MATTDGTTTDGTTTADNSDQNEDAVNNKFQQIQAAYVNEMRSKTNEPTTVTVDEDMENYKDYVMNSIISKGTSQTQKDLVTFQKDSTSKAVTPAEGSSLIALDRRFPKSDDPVYFFGNRTYTTNIFKIPQSGQVAQTPWSSTYWATRHGGISVRYVGGRMNTAGSLNWRQSISRYRQPSEFRANYRYPNFSSQVNGWYSPSEKYDLVLGDTSFSMTNYVKNEGFQWARNGDIPSWYGICHGWALAAYEFKRPYKPVTMRGATGVTVRFLPDDIKALASQYWANVKYTTRWIGNRCNSKQNTARWSYDSTCRSLNPGSFVVSLGNWMGLLGNSVVIDPKADPEIWNQPVKAYSLRYYNIATGAFYASAKAAMISRDRLRYCGTQWCRTVFNTSSGAAAVVGAFIRVTYVVETNPIFSTTTRPDSLKTENFDSALELDENGNISGGEWRYNVYPNFMWTAELEKPVEGVSDAAVPYFGGSVDELNKMTSFAQTASKRGQVLKAFINWLK
jgi:hypothetical protein